MNLKRLIRKSVAFGLAKTPKDFRYRIIRHLLHLPEHFPKNLVVKMASTPDEYQQAFEVLQKNYASEGLAESELQLRTSKYHTLPTSHVAIVKHNDKVIATLTHILDNPLGLPIESSWSLEKYRQQGLLLAEISSLAIDRNWRHNHGLFLLLTRFILDFAIQHIGVDSWVMVTHPKAKDFYSGVLGFESLTEEVKSIGSVRDAVGFGQILNLNTLKGKFKDIYEGTPPQRNIYEFYFLKDFSDIFIVPDKSSILTNNMSLDCFIDVFTNKSNTLEGLDQLERRVLAGLYMQIKEKFGFSDIPRLRHRSPVSLAATLMTSSTLMSVKVLNVSTGGLKVLTKAPIQTNDKLVLALNVEDYHFRLPVEVIWTHHNRFHGLKICGPPHQKWESWTKKVNKDFVAQFLKPAA